MNYEQIIFFRNLLFRAFLIGLAFALFYWIATCAGWKMWGSWSASLFKIDEKEFGKAVILFFLNMRIVLVFFSSCQPWPCIGWLERSGPDKLEV